jgi:hypothetical protein
MADEDPLSRIKPRELSKSLTLLRFFSAQDTAARRAARLAKLADFPGRLSWAEVATPTV